MQLFQKLTIMPLVGARVQYAAFYKFWFCVVDGKLHVYFIIKFTTLSVVSD
jgi:hypothetical protein